ncbi:hypothetical protein MSP8887_02641 [Marinomonas spartinae]|uniref:Zinc finger DksA/TraR C4-type domain-containing protein n=1 Tax=Marinomonas spartinae TaxID=1792290 RepID=A0A1A8TEI2_9GAMM|nr:TraR/DksA C4-type zinc finger protein [Marinomonas spartinae]NVK28799.1 TraR/DksA C4-type zinc finger protein [Flavobacteriia bacterium]SBS30491.1 hypothetical protein MSP8886_01830 [Marinomonas spartinae]SBS36589.1 hypothetical protein MSP8887_02641 [Marinomonas spartinae]
MDLLDWAADLEEAFRAASIQQHRQQGEATFTTHCVDCDEVIPAPRRAALPHTTRCIDCQQDEEKRQ